jgi:hypothetical protein
MHTDPIRGAVMTFGEERENAKVEHPFHGLKVDYFLNNSHARRADADRAELKAFAGGGCYTTVQFEKDAKFGWYNLDSAIALAERCHEFGREAYREELVKFLGIKNQR